MLGVKTKDPFQPDRVSDDPLPHFAPFFLDEELRETWEAQNARRAQAGDLFAAPNVGFHHNPMESGVSYLYVVESPNQPDEVKIGMTDRPLPQHRVSEAARDAAFRNDPDARLVGYVMMKNVRARQVEAATHRVLSGRRSQTGSEREWFRLDPAEAMSAIELAAHTYRHPRRLDTFSALIRQGESPSALLILNEFRPDLISGGVRFREPDPDRDLPDTGTVRSAKGRALFSTYQAPGEAEETVAFLPIVPAPESYLWENAGALLPQRSELLGEEWPDRLRLSYEGRLAHFDRSAPEDAPFLRARMIPARVRPDGRVDLLDTVGAPHRIDQDRPVFFETDLTRSDLMRTISSAYWRIRSDIEELLPRSEEGLKDDRDLYLHALTSFLIASRPEEITPENVGVISLAAARIAETPAELRVCPVALAEVVEPTLRAARAATPAVSAPEEGASCPAPAPG